jgi:hypothetical protein
MGGVKLGLYKIAIYICFPILITQVVFKDDKEM